MKPTFTLGRLGALVFCLWISSSTTTFAQASDPLRIYLRGGPKTHGPAGNGLHEHERWARDWQTLLRSRGARVEAGLTFPTADQLKQTDVLVMFAANAGSIPPAQRAYLETFLKRGGGLVCLHDAVCGDDAPWFKTIIGGAWEHGHSKWFEGEISFYYVNNDHPITRGASNFDIDDEVYWDLHMMPQARILAASWQPDQRNTIGGRPHPHIYDVIPQMWVYENQLEGGQPYRSFASLLGHKYATFEQPHVRAVLLRGIAWAGGREIDSLCAPDELASLRYPAGGPTAPERAADLLELHPDFEMELVAAEPLVIKPMNLDWDPSGNLWVAETPEYPNGRRGLRPDMKGEEWKDHGGVVAEAGLQQRPARDRISRLADTDGDGRMDQRRIFYEGLELVTSFVFYRDGVIASAAPHIYWLRDTDQDGKADRTEILYTGLGTRDTHAVINNLRWGYDGWIYATHGYSAGDVKSGDGAREFGRIGSGVVRLRPDGSAFEQYSSKGGNTWGLDIAWDNEVFFTQPTSGDLLNHVVLPESVLAKGKVGRTTSYKAIIQRRRSFPLIKPENLAYVQIDQVGYFTAAAGCAIYDGGAWPEAWHYSYFTGEPTVSLVHHEVVTPEGPSFGARKVREAEFIGGRDLWYCPIETRVGPDGALYIIDFYNQAVIHNDTRGPRHNQVNAAVRPDRDHYFGRIFQVNHRQARDLTVPDLAGAPGSELVNALEHVNQHTRMTALRLLVERGDKDVAPALAGLVRGAAQPSTRVAAIWALHRLQAVSPDLLQTALADSHAAVRKNALRVAQNDATLRAGPGSPLRSSVLKAARDKDSRVRLEAILALGSRSMDRETASALVALYPGLDNAWLESAVVGLMADSPLLFLEAALASAELAPASGLVEQLARQIADQQNAALASRLTVSLAAQPSAADDLKRIVLEILAQNLRPEVVPDWTEPLREAFERLLHSPNQALAVAALPLMARWDRDQSLAADLSALVQQLLRQLSSPDMSAEEKAQLAVSLIGVHRMDDRILPATGRILAGDQPFALKESVIGALGNVPDPAAGRQLAGVYPALEPSLQEMAEGEILKRPPSALVFLEAIRNGEIIHQDLRPSTLHRLRNHSSLEVARTANTLFDELRGPELKEKNALITALIPAVQKPGRTEQGRVLFEQNCATCHKFGDVGRDVGPNLTGMGAHGPAELLVHIIDPNRAVEDNYVSVSIETKDDELYDGIVLRENRTSLILRNASGEMEISKRDVASRRKTGRSLMPEGFEALGEEGMRDLLAYMTAEDSNYRFLDLSSAFTADHRKGIYADENRTWDTLKFLKYGPVSVEGVPFNIVNPLQSPGARNLVVLKGGATADAHSKTFPRQVELEVGFPVAALHFLGGVGGWAYPYGGETAKDLPVLKATVVYEDGAREDIVMRNGREFADYIRETEVPGSTLAKGVVRENQVRYYGKKLQTPGPVQKIILESYDNQVAPTTVAITAELPESGAATTAARPAASAATQGPAIRTLIVGGGASHDYETWFDKADSATLSRGRLARVEYTEDTSKIKAQLPELDVLYLSNNKPIPDPATRQAIFEFVEKGGGLLLVHPALWYNWRDWPEYNRQLAGGGSRGHDRLGPFDVKVTRKEHPIMAGVSEEFNLVDELYYFQPDPQGSPIQVLATAHSQQKNETYPMVWTVDHPGGRIACIALGHDGRAHQHPDYQRLLRNALKWAAGR